MDHYELLYPGRFLKKQALTEPKVIRILEVIATELENEKGKMEQKVTIKYKAADGDGEIVWCKSNAALTAAALDTPYHQQWVGKLLTIHHDPNVRFGGKAVGGVRVFGSPEMTKQIKVEIKMPRKKTPDVYVLVPTDKKGHPIAKGAAKPEGAPPLAEEPPQVQDDPGFTEGVAP